MSSIMKYILNMIPYIVISVPIYMMIRFIIIKTRKLKVNWYREITLLLFVLFIIALASQTIIPKFEFGVNGVDIVKNRKHTTNFIPFKVLFETYYEVFINGNINYFLINFLGNIIMFMPIGFFLPLLWHLSNKKVITLGFVFSLVIEICQIFLPRGTDIDDLILNTMGTILGLLLYKITYKKLKKLRSSFQ